MSGHHQAVVTRAADGYIFGNWEGIGAISFSIKQAQISVDRFRHLQRLDVRPGQAVRRFGCRLVKLIILQVGLRRAAHKLAPFHGRLVCALTGRETMVIEIRYLLYHEDIGDGRIGDVSRSDRPGRRKKFCYQF